MLSWTYGGYLWRWCCPVCGNLNNLASESSRAGFCQAFPCAAARGDLARLHRFQSLIAPTPPLRLQPEIIRAFERPLPWGMA